MTELLTQDLASGAPATSSCLLLARGLRKAFGGQVVLGHIDLELHRGEAVLLRGENGSGKTTLLNILCGNLEPDAGTIRYRTNGASHTYRFPRRFWQELNPVGPFTPDFLAREAIGRTWQDVRLFGALILRDNIAVARPDNPGENPLRALLPSRRLVRREAAIRGDADALLSRLGLHGRAASSADRISLGESKRIAIARAVTAGAKILFLDEPLAGLDRAGIAGVLALLDTLVHDSNLSLVIVEHVFNQAHLRNLVSTDWLLERGTLASASVGPARLALAPAAVARPEWLAILSGTGPEMLDQPLPRGALLTRVRRPRPSQAAEVPVLDVRRLVVRRGPRIVIGLDDYGALAGFDLTVNEGEIAILQAPNGWGKSTLFSALTGLIPVDSGDIDLAGRSLAGLAPWERLRRGLRAQPADRGSFPNLRVKEALSLAGMSSPEAAAVPLANRPCSSLSGGERQWVAVRQTLAADGCPALLLLDEPFSAFDRKALEGTLRCVAEAPSRALLILIPSTAG